MLPIPFVPVIWDKARGTRARSARKERIFVMGVEKALGRWEDGVEVMAREVLQLQSTFSLAFLYTWPFRRTRLIAGRKILARS